MSKMEKPNDNPPATNIPDKRYRGYGMFEDPLVTEKNDKIEAGLQKKINAFYDTKRQREIYDFIIKHRPGKPVRVGRTIRGGYNAIFHLEYTDGAAALRVPLPGQNAFPDEKVRVEVATLRYIEKMTSIPVPHVYHWGTAAENPLGLGPFIIMDYINHDKNLEDVLRDPAFGHEAGPLDPNIPRAKLKRLYRQVARIILQLSKLEMPKIGSLQQQGDSFIIGSRPLTQDMNDLVVQGGIPPSILPPETATFSTSAEWYAVLADAHFAHLAFQRNDAINSADDCRDKFVARHLFRQLLRRGKFGTPPPRRTKKESFPLCIEDLRPHNILVDANLNIVGVIDWEWAYFAPRAFAHDLPWWLLLQRYGSWSGSVLDFRDKYAKALDVFLDALRAEEGLAAARQLDEGWSIDQHIEALSLDAVPLSEQMRRSWESGAFWANYAARKCFGFEPVFWEFLDERFFGANVEGGYEGRMNLLSAKAKKRMEWFVERKVEESKERKIVDWDPEEARAYLAEILADLD
ncbi:kinase-like domain-containing protein, partial [Chaetomium tenue]